VSDPRSFGDQRPDLLEVGSYRHRRDVLQSEARASLQSKRCFTARAWDVGAGVRRVPPKALDQVIEGLNEIIR
jgi:hypothetical protein